MIDLDKRWRRTRGRSLGSAVGRIVRPRSGARRRGGVLGADEPTGDPELHGARSSRRCGARPVRLPPLGRIQRRELVSCPGVPARRQREGRSRDRELRRPARAHDDRRRADEAPALGHDLPGNQRGVRRPERTAVARTRAGWDGGQRTIAQQDPADGARLGVRDAATPGVRRTAAGVGRGPGGLAPARARFSGVSPCSAPREPRLRVRDGPSGDATVDALRQQLAERDRTIEQMCAANEAHQNLIEEERRAASQARRLAALRRRRIAELERRLRSAEERADHWERRADRLGRLALEAMCPQARIDDRQPEDRIGVGSVTLDGAALLRTSAALS